MKSNKLKIAYLVIFFCFSNQLLSQISLNCIENDSIYLHLNNTNDIILFGENHRINTKKLYPQIDKILKKNKITTLFIEGSYSEYLFCCFHSKLTINFYSIFNNNPNYNLVYIDVEDDVDESLLVLLDILKFNNLQNSSIYNELKYLKKYWGLIDNREVKLFSILESLKKEVSIHKYENELKKLIELMIETHSCLNINDDYNSDNRIRDSLMFEHVSKYIATNKITKWAGIFGYAHIIQENDSILNESANLKNNFYDYLKFSDTLLENKRLLRIIAERKKTLYRDCTNRSEFYENFQYRFDYDLFKYCSRRKLLLGYQNDILWILQ